MQIKVPLLFFFFVFFLPSQQRPNITQDYSNSFWINGWRKVASDTTSPFLAIESNRYDFSLNLQDFTKSGFSFVPLRMTGYGEVLSSTSGDRMKSLPPVALYLDIKTSGQIYRGANCLAGRLKSGEGRLSSARMWEAGRFVQHYDFSGVLFTSPNGKILPLNGVLDLVAWPSSLTFTLKITPQQNQTWNSSTIRVQLVGLVGQSVKVMQEQTFFGSWNTDQEKSVTITVNASSNYTPSTNITVTSPWKNQKFPVNFDPKKNCLTAKVETLSRPANSFEKGSLQAYDNFTITITNQNNQAGYLPFLLDFRKVPGITGLVPILCDKQGNPTGIPVQLSKNWHYANMTNYLMAYMIIPITNLQNEYVLRVVYGFYGTIPSASHSQLSIVGYSDNGNGRWEQLAIGSWGETFCIDMDMNLVNNVITDVRMLMSRNGVNGSKWGWTDAGWGGDWLVAPTLKGEKLSFNEMKTAYFSQGPCLTDVQHSGFYGNAKDVSLEAKIHTIRTDDYARTFHNLNYRFNRNFPAQSVFFFRMGIMVGWAGYLTPKVAFGNRNGLIAQYDVPSNLDKTKPLINQLELSGEAPWWVTFPAQYFNDGKTWGTGYRALIIRSYNTSFGGKTYTQPIISMPVNTAETTGISLNVVFGAPAQIGKILQNDTVDIDVEWITLHRSLDDYYGKNAAYIEHLKLKANTWETAYREAIGNDLAVKTFNATVVSKYPLILEVSGSVVWVSINSTTGGAGYLPIRFQGVDCINNVAIYEIINGNKVKLDQSSQGNDFWQVDFDDLNGKYRVSFNLPLDSKTLSEWVFMTN